MKEKKRKFRHEHGGSFSVDYYAYASHMRSWNAGFKVLFSIISLLIYISMLLVPIIFLIFGTIAIAIGFSMHPVGQYHVHFLNLFYIYCSKASLLKAGNLVFKALGAVSALYMMTLTTPLSEIIAVLRKAHVPKLIIELMILKHLVIPLDRLAAICWLFH